MLFVLVVHHLLKLASTATADIMAFILVEVHLVLSGGELEHIKRLIELQWLFNFLFSDFLSCLCIQCRVFENEAQFYILFLSYISFLSLEDKEA